MNAMNVIGHRRREAVEHGASSAARGIGLCIAAAGFAPGRSFAPPFEGEIRHKDLISRRLQKKQSLFDTFLSCKGVDFSPVTKKAPFFSHGSKRSFRTGTTPQAPRVVKIAHRAICSHL
jgi:hypothetical protein